MRSRQRLGNQALFVLFKSEVIERANPGMYVGVPRRGIKICRKIFHIDRFAHSHHACMPESIFEFSDVPRPVVAPEGNLRPLC